MVTWAGLDLSQPIVMGILNVTPDSFSDGGDFTNLEIAAAHAEAMAHAGAKIIDVGGESTRPGAVMPSLQEEIDRVVPVIAAMKNCGVKISIDTRRAAVMAAAVAAGAEIINDVSALSTDPDAAKFVAEKQLPVVLCHMRGTPQTMQKNPVYENVVHDVMHDLSIRIDACVAAGLSRDKICIDPGIGFGKATAHNIALLQNLSDFKKLGAPILIGLSRKRMIAEITGVQNPKDRLAGSIAGALFAAQQGANILRVHDVAETVQALQVWQSLNSKIPPP